MKKFFFSVAALAAAISFTACSSEDVVESPSNNIAGSTGYMAFNIGMPVDNGTRANDNFNKGDEEEYKVYDAVLLLFDGEDEATAKFHSAYDLNNTTTGEIWTDDTHPAGDGNVTVDKKYIAKVEGTPAHPKALVVINGNGIFKVDGTTHSLSVGGANFPTGHAFSELQDMTKESLDLTATDFHNKGILMMNAHLWSKGGESVNPTLDGGAGHLLSTVAPDNIYPTKAAAEADGAQATSIFVERAVAKVTVKAAAGDISSSEVPFSAVMQNWVLDNTNKSSYLIRSIEGFNTWAPYKNINKYRMVGPTTVGHQGAITLGGSAHNAYRTYFAKDTNYDGDVIYGTHTNKAGFTDDVYNTTIDMGKSAYCAENTFDVERMKYGNTTRVIVKANITPDDTSLRIGGGFYSRPGDDKFYSEEQMKTVLQNNVNSYLAGLGDKITGLGTVTYTITTAPDHKTFTVKAANITPESSLVGDDLAIVNALIGAGGKEYSIHSIGYDFYEGGVCYYDSRIQHFGQDHTPWTAHNAANVDEAYGTDASRDASYLGRWGVLRNNWYELSVNKVSKIGYAHPWNLSFDPNDNPDDPTTPPYDPETPDDNQKSELWISIDVNILSWAKREQPVEF